MVLSSSKLRRFYLDNHAYFATTVTNRRLKVFSDPSRAELLMRVNLNFQKQDYFSLLAFVIMPDHLHLLLLPDGGKNISQVMHSIKRSSARLIHQAEETSGTLWQRRFFDRVVRSEKELLDTIQYIHNNPVVDNLVEQADEYPFSSANPRYAADLRVPMG